MKLNQTQTAQETTSKFRGAGFSVLHLSKFASLTENAKHDAQIANGEASVWVPAALSEAEKDRKIRAGENKRFKRGIQAILKKKNATTGLFQALRSDRAKKAIRKQKVERQRRKATPKSTVMAEWEACKERDKQIFEENGAEEGKDEDVETQQYKEVTSASIQNRVEHIEETCRCALLQETHLRSHTEIQVLKCWLQNTKVQKSTDFDSLQSHELDLLCKRMSLLTFDPGETVFSQGDIGDALYIVFTGLIEVKTNNFDGKVCTEKHICDLGKNNYFGERALLNSEPRAASVVAKQNTELIRISSEDYNAVLKQNQQEFINRSKLAADGALGIHFKSTQENYRNILRKVPSSRSKKEVIELSYFVKTLKFFHGMVATFVRELCTVIDFIIIQPNTYVFREGEVGDLFYIVLSGTVDVKINKVDYRGNTIPTKITTLRDGAHFGELALMKGQGKRSASIVTVTSCEFLTISEADYNNILSKLQKADLREKIALLGQFSICHNTIWTAAMIQEVAYVLTMRRYGIGEELIRAGSKANEIFFIARGEAAVTEMIQDPITKKTCSVFKGRVGKLDIVGEDGAKGSTCGEQLTRLQSVTSTTPINVLVLSRYDLFNRLSSTARVCVQTYFGEVERKIVNIDRVYKTQKWETYKKKLINDLQLKKRMPGKHQTRIAPSGTSTMAVNPDEQSCTVVDHFAACEKAMRSIDQLSHVPGICDEKATLVQADEFILLPQKSAREKDHLFKKTVERTHMNSMQKMSLAYNPDGPVQSPEARLTLLNKVMHHLANEHRSITEEGNPLSYLGHLEINDPNDTIDWMSNNFVFSPPQVKMLDHYKKESLKLKQAMKLKSEKQASQHSQTTQNSSTIGTFVLANFANELLHPACERPAFRILGQFENEKAMERHVKTMVKEKSCLQNIDYHCTLIDKHILIPRTEKHIRDTSYCAARLSGYVSYYYSKQRKLPFHVAQTKYGSMCGTTKLLQDESRYRTTGKFVDLENLSSSAIPLNYRQRESKFAAVLVFPDPSAAGVAMLDGVEPIIRTFGCFASETAATDAANKAASTILLEFGLTLHDHIGMFMCVVPLYEWIYFDDVVEWQVTSKSERFQNSPNMSTTCNSRSRTSSRILAKQSYWRDKHEKAQRLHQSVLVRLSTKSNDRVETQENIGYTVPSQFSLDQKLSSLTELLSFQRGRCKTK